MRKLMYIIMLTLISGCATPMHVDEFSSVPFKVMENKDDSTLTIEVPIILEEQPEKSVHDAFIRALQNGLGKSSFSSVDPVFYHSADCEPFQWPPFPKGEELTKVRYGHYIWRKTIPNWISCKGKLSAKKCNNELFLRIMPSVAVKTVCKGPRMKYRRNSVDFKPKNVVDYLAERFAYTYYDSEWAEGEDLNFTSYTLPVEGNIDSPYAINCVKGQCVIETKDKPLLQASLGSSVADSVQLTMEWKSNLNSKQTKQVLSLVRRADRKIKNKFMKALNRGRADVWNRNTAQVQQCYLQGGAGTIKYETDCGDGSLCVIYGTPCREIVVRNEIINTMLYVCQQHPETCGL